MKFTIDVGVDSDRDWLANHLRVEDRDEVEGLCGMEASWCVDATWLKSKHRWCWKVDGERFARFGLGEVHGVGIPWLLGSRLMDKWSVRLEVGRRSRGIIHTMFLDKYEKLANLVDARRKKTIDWLIWCGFRVLPPRQVGENMLYFHPFLMDRTQGGLHVRGS